MAEIYEEDLPSGFKFADELLEEDSFLHKLQKALFRAHARDYNIQKDTENSYKANLLGHLLLRLITTLQLLTLVIPLESTIQSFQKFEFLIKLIYCTRFDYLFHTIQQDWTFWYLHISIVCSASILFIADYILLLAGIKRSQSRLRATRLYLMYLIKGLMLMPILLESTFYISQDFGYKFERFLYMTEYATNSQKEICSSLGFFTLILLAFLLFVNTVFHYDISFRKINGSYRAHSVVTLKKYICLFMMPWIYFFIGGNLLYRLIILVICGYMVYQYYHYLPFYSMNINLLECNMFLTLGWAAVLMILAELLDSAILLFANLFGIGPFLILFLHVLIQKRLESLDCMEITSPYIVELKVRKILSELRYSNTFEHVPAVEELFNQATKKFPTFKHLYIWESIYYLEFTRNIHIALLKLSKLHWANLDIIRYRCLFRIGITTEESKFRSFSIEAEFFKYMVLGSLLKVYKTEEQKLIKYYQWINTIKSKDLSFCSKMLSFFELLGNPTSHTQREIYKIIRGIADSLTDTLRQFKRAFRMFPQDPFILDMFGSFLNDIAQNNIGEEMKNKAYYEKAKLKKENSINNFESYLQKNVGIIIISGVNKDFGSLVYINELAADILETTPQTALGTNIAQFVPPAFNYLHDDQMIRYILFSHGPEVYRHHIVMVSAKKHLVEVTFRFRIHCHKKGAHFIVAMKEKPKNRDLLIYGSDGSIIGYTDNLAEILDTQLVNKNVFDLFPDIQEMFIHPIPYNPFIYYIGEYHKQIGLMFAHVDIGRCRIFMIYAFIRADCLNDLIHKSSLTDTEKQNLSNIKKRLRIIIESSSGHLLSKQKSQFVEKIKNKKLQIISNKYKPEGENATISPQIHRRDRLISDAKNNTSSIFISSETKNREKEFNQKIERQIKCFHGIMILILMLIIASCISVVTLIFESSINWNGYDTIDKLGYGRAALSNVVLNLRNLNLINSGFKLKYDESVYRADLLNTLDQIKDNERLIQTVNMNHRSTLKISEKVLTVKQREVRFEDAVHEFISHSSVMYSAPLQDIQIQNSSFYYVYRNGLQELFQAMNETTFYYQADESERLNMLSDEMFISELAIIVPVIALLVLGVGPMIWISEKQNSKVWSALEDFNLGEVKQRMTIFKDRIELVHSIELPDRVVQIGKIKKFSISIWHKFVMKLCVLIVLSIAVHVVIWEIGQSEINKCMNFMLYYINWNGLSRGSYLRTYFWMRESYLELRNTSSYSQMIPEAQFIPSPEYSFINETSTFYFMHSKLSIQENMNMIDLSVEIEDIKDILYGHPCEFITEELESCTNLYLSNGSAPSSLDYISYLHTLYSMAKQGYDVQQQVIQAEGIARDLSKLKIQSFNIFTDAFLKRLKYLQEILISMVILYALIVLLLWLFLYRPSINSIKKDILDFKRICGLIKLKS